MYTTTAPGGGEVTHPLWVRATAPAVVVATALAAWWALAAVLDLGPFLLPGPQHVVEQLHLHRSYLAGQTALTVWHTLAGFVAGSAAAVLLACGLAMSPLAQRACMPLLVALQAVPKVALAPLLAIWLGYGPASKITLVALLCFFPVLVAALAGLTSTPAELVELGRSLSANPLRIFVKIRVPWALPQLATGLKVGVSLALIGAVVAQIAHPNAGLGTVIVRAGQATNTPLAFAALLLLAAVGIALFYAVVAVERWALPWARETSG